MIRPLIFSAMAGLLLVGAAAASDDEYKAPNGQGSSAAELAALNNDQIRNLLQEQGYDVLRMEREGGEIEVYARKDGLRWELEVDPRNGRILEAETER